MAGSATGTSGAALAGSGANRKKTEAAPIDLAGLMIGGTKIKG